MTVPKVLKHAFYLFLVFVVSMIVGTLGAYYVWQTRSNLTVEPLDDFMFKYLPDFSDHFVDYPVPNWVMAAMITVGLFSFPYKYVFQYAAQFFLLESVITGLRGLVIGLTLFPLTVHNEACLHRPESFIETIELMMKYGTCGDFMFSGHTATAFLAYLFVAKHKKNYLFQFVQGLLLGGMFLSLLVFHWHYTLDIVMALFVSFLFFHVYKEYEHKTDYWFYFHEFVLGKKETRINYEILKSQL